MPKPFIMITGVDKPTFGAVTVIGVDVANASERKLTRWRGRNTGILYQFFPWLPTLTVLENVMMPLDCTGEEIESRLVAGR
jgi:putative ABC transport system ATP-binding protein